MKKIVNSHNQYTANLNKNFVKKIQLKPLKIPVAG